MKQIANYITMGNLLCGLMAISALVTGDSHAPLVALSFMGLAAVLDFLDGFVARLLKADGEMGKQLDSLADLVSFGGSWPHLEALYVGIGVLQQQRILHQPICLDIDSTRGGLALGKIQCAIG